MLNHSRVPTQCAVTCGGDNILEPTAKRQAGGWWVWAGSMGLFLLAGSNHLLYGRATPHGQPKAAAPSPIARNTPMPGAFQRLVAVAICMQPSQAYACPPIPLTVGGVCVPLTPVCQPNQESRRTSLRGPTDSLWTGQCGSHGWGGCASPVVVALCGGVQPALEANTGSWR